MIELDRKEIETLLKIRNYENNINSLIVRRLIEKGLVKKWESRLTEKGEKMAEKIEETQKELRNMVDIDVNRTGCNR